MSPEVVSLRTNCSMLCYSSYFSKVVWFLVVAVCGELHLELVLTNSIL